MLIARRRIKRKVFDQTFRKVGIFFAACCFVSFFVLARKNFIFASILFEICFLFATSFHWVFNVKISVKAQLKFCKRIRQKKKKNCKKLYDVVSWLYCTSKVCSLKTRTFSTISLLVHVAAAIIVVFCCLLYPCFFPLLLWFYVNNCSVSSSSLSHLSNDVRQLRRLTLKHIITILRSNWHEMVMHSRSVK